MEQKCSRRDVNVNQCPKMLKCMDYCNLLDLEALGQSLLGATKGWGLQYTRVRFDRTLANSKCCVLSQSFFGY